MGFRFQRRVRVFPGVRLNFSSSGISTTIGVPGASINIGGKGATANVGLPGTGISWRQPLSNASRGHDLAPGTSPVLSPAPEQQQPTTPTGEIRSGSSDEVTSVGLREFRSLVAEAHQISTQLEKDRPNVETTEALSTKRFASWDRGWLLRRLFQQRFEERRAAMQSAIADRHDLEQALERCRVAVEIEMEQGIESTYGQLVESFRAFAASGAIWDTTASVAVDKRAERSAADHAVSRRAVQLSSEGTRLLRCSRMAMRFPNANGGDLIIYPGLLILLRSDRDFGLVNLSEVRLVMRTIRFFEQEKPPHDAERVGTTWLRVNKDGRPDRRFSHNPEIPIYEYAELDFTSASGVNERYMVSNVKNARAFEASFHAHQRTLPV